MTDCRTEVNFAFKKYENEAKNNNIEKELASHIVPGTKCSMNL
jgi:hypothetical protein